MGDTAFSSDHDSKVISGFGGQPFHATARLQAAGAHTVMKSDALNSEQPPPFHTQYSNFTSRQNYQSTAPTSTHEEATDCYTRPGPSYSMTQLKEALPNYPPQQANYAPQPPANYAMTQPNHQTPASYLTPLTNATFVPSMPGHFPPSYPGAHYIGGFYAVAPPQQYATSYPAHPYPPSQPYPNMPGQTYSTAPFLDPRNTAPNLSQPVGMHGFQSHSSHLQPGMRGGQITYRPDRAGEFVSYNPSISSGEAATYGSWISKGEPVFVPSTTSRGPPRKPRQSGHALWVGNLPPNATVTDLKDHFSREATNEIESLKLIAKSSCAFVNYRTQSACAAAMARFHDSRFHGTRLVCRLRRTMGPLSASNDATTGETRVPDGNSESATEVPDGPTKGAVPEKIFILKSLTLQDLEISTRNGLWATQSHNEEVLNEAFKSAENVYLVFSVNKSGEYFGYARMLSPITVADASDDLSMQREKRGSLSTIPDGQQTATTTSIQVEPYQDFGLKAINTPATQWAPKGRIIDDPARGTIFWEADIDDDPESEVDRVSLPDIRSAIADGQPAIATSDKLWTGDAAPSEVMTVEEQSAQLPGNSFKLEWLCRRKLPFYKTRGLRNSWNANREVKIARDGTELETVTGKKLLSLFGPVGPIPRPVFN